MTEGGRTLWAILDKPTRRAKKPGRRQWRWDLNLFKVLNQNITLYIVLPEQSAEHKEGFSLWQAYCTSDGHIQNFEVGISGPVKQGVQSTVHFMQFLLELQPKITPSDIWVWYLVNTYYSTYADIVSSPIWRADRRDTAANNKGASVPIALLKLQLSVQFSLPLVQSKLCIRSRRYFLRESLFSTTHNKCCHVEILKPCPGTS